MGMLEQLRRRVTSFAARTDGGVTVEFVMWLPILLGLCLTIADGALMFARQSNFWNVSRETARIVSRHAMDPTAAEAFARGRVAFAGHTPDVNVQVKDAEVIVTITGNAKDMAPFGMLAYVLGDRVSTQVVHALEPI